MKRVKRTLAVILVLAFTLGVLPAAAADTAAATTLRLAGATGTVSITNASGKAQSVKTDMRLYSGYGIATGKASAAYISLDGTKAVKFDSSSRGSIKKSGNKLEVCLDDGALFFDVTAPLAPNESLNIRTGTMVTGIRGSFGWVTRTEVVLAHGHAAVTCINPVTGETRTTELYSGEKVYYDPASTVTGDPELKEIDFIKEIITNDDFPAFVVEEMRKDESLQTPVIEDVPSVDVPKLLEDYDQIKAAEDEKISEKEEELEQKLEEQTEFIENDPVDYLFDDEISGAAAYTVNVRLPASILLTGELGSGGAITPVNNADGTQKYEVPEGDSLVFTLGDTAGYYIDGAVQVELNGAALAAPYTVTSAGTVSAENIYYRITSATVDTLFDSLDAYGSVVYDDAAVGTLTVSGHVKGGQTLMLTAGSNMTIGAGASLTIDEDGDLKNNGTLTNNGTFVNNSSHTVYNNAGATITNNVAFINNGRMINGGAIGNYGDMTFAGGSVVENTGDISNNGGGHTLTLAAGATVNNGGTVTNWDTFNNSGTINNTGDFNNTAGTLTNNGIITADGTAVNGDTVTGTTGGITATLTAGGNLTLAGTGALPNGNIWSAFSDGVTVLTIDDGITSIGAEAFRGCSTLNSVTIPASVTSIGADAFAGCQMMVRAVFEGSMPIMGSGVFDGVNDEFLICFDYDKAGWYDKLGDDNTVNGYPAVSCARGTCGPTLNYTIYTEGRYDEDAGENSGLELSSLLLTAEEEETSYCWLEITGTGDMYNFDSYSEVPWYGQKILSVELPEELTSIGARAFYKCDTLESVSIPDGVTYIGEWAFCDCKAMAVVMMPSGLTQIGSGAFEGCSSLRQITVPAGVTVLDKDVFSQCSNLMSILILGDVTTVDDYAFRSCRSLTSLDLPDTVTYIGTEALAYCTGLTTLELPAGLTSFGVGALKGCSGISSIIVPAGVTEINSQVFRECGGLTNVEFAGAVTSLGVLAFSYCSSLAAFTIPNTVTSIGDYCFQGCGSLTGITIPDSVTSIGSKVFGECGSLAAIELPAGTAEIPESFYWRCSGLVEYVIPDGVTTIGANAFAGCTSLAKLTIPASVTTAGANVFDGSFASGAQIIYKGTQSQWDSLKSTLFNGNDTALQKVTVTCEG